jgi:hypothetical protein
MNVEIEMNKFLIFFNFAFSEEDTFEIIFSKNYEFRRSMFRYGISWSASGNVTLLKTETSQEKLSNDLVNSIDRVSDFVSIIAIPENPSVMYGGWLVDDESFLELLPGAVDMTYEDPSPPVST